MLLALVRSQASSTHHEGVGLLRRARRWTRQHAPTHTRNGHCGGLELAPSSKARGTGRFAQLEDGGGGGTDGAAAALGARVSQIFEGATPRDPRQAKVDDVFSRFSIDAGVDTADDPRL